MITPNESKSGHSVRSISPQQSFASKQGVCGKRAARPLGSRGGRGFECSCPRGVRGPQLLARSMWTSWSRPKRRGRCTSGGARAAHPTTHHPHSPARTLACMLHRSPSDLQGNTAGDASCCRGADPRSQGNWWPVFRPWWHVFRPRCPSQAVPWRRGTGGARARDDDATRVGLLARLARSQAAGRAARAPAFPRP